MHHLLTPCGASSSLDNTQNVGLIDAPPNTLMKRIRTAECVYSECLYTVKFVFRISGTNEKLTTNSIQAADAAVPMATKAVSIQSSISLPTWRAFVAESSLVCMLIY